MANIPLKTLKFPGLDDTYTVPSKTSDLTNDSGFVTASTAPVTSVNSKTGAVTLTASDVGALSSSTTIPSKTSDLTNDSGFLTSHSTWYGTSSTAASTTAKVVTCSGFALSTGAVIGILFSTANTAATPTLNVNSTGAKSIYVGASTPSATTNVLKWSANTMLYFQYDGTYFRFITSVSAGNVIPSRGANTWYGTNSVAAATAAKTAAIDNFVLTKGAMVSIVSTTANTANAPTLNVNSTGAIAIYYNNAVTSSSNQLLWNANDILNFMYDGTYWRFLGKAVTKTSQLTNDSGFITNAGVTSFNGSTGAVTYTAPVTSVNGSTGAVSISVPTKTSDLTNDSGFVTDAGVTSFNGSTGAVTYTAPVTSVNGQTGAVTGLQTTANLVTSMSSSSTDTQYPSAKAVYDAVSAGSSKLIYYGTCSTDATTRDKVVSCSGFKKEAGAVIAIKFTYGNTTDYPRLNVNSTNASYIAINGVWNNSATAGPLYWQQYSDRLLYFMFDGEVFQYINTNSTWYGTNSVTASTAAKTVSINGFVLSVGTRVSIQSSTSNTATGITLNVSNTGAKSIYYNNAAVSSTNPLVWSAGALLNFIFDGTYWRFLGESVTKDYVNNQITAAIGTAIGGSY